jgi:hypothetical protein
MALEDLPPKEHEGAGQPVDLDLVVAFPVAPEQEPLAPRRRHQLVKPEALEQAMADAQCAVGCVLTPPVRVAQLTPHHADVRTFEQEMGRSSDDVIAHIRVAVQEQQQIPARRRHALVAGAGEAKVRLVDQQLGLWESIPDKLGASVLGGVIDDDDLETARCGVLLKRGKATLKIGSRIPRNNHHAHDRQMRHARPIAYMSSPAGTRAAQRVASTPASVPATARRPHGNLCCSSVYTW